MGYNNFYLKKKVLDFLLIFDRVWLISLQHVPNMTPKIFVKNIYNMGIKNAEFDVNFESVEKVSRKFKQRKLEG